MSVKAGYYKEYEGDFVLDEGKLRKIAATITEHASKLIEPTFLEFLVEREDDRFYITKDIAEIMEDDNAHGRMITKIDIELIRSNSGLLETEPILDSDRKKSLIGISFSSRRIPRIKFHVQEKERGWCYLTADDIDSQIQRITKGKRWWRSIANGPIDFVLIMLAMGLFFIATVYPNAIRQHNIGRIDNIKTMSIDERTIKILQLLDQKNITEVTNIKTYGVPLVMLILMAVLTALFSPFENILKKMNRSCFYWNDAVLIYDKQEKKWTMIKWSILIAFGVSFAASLVATFITN